MVTKIISGGQTGVDQGALDGACLVLMDVGGYAPKGWKTELGEDQELLQNAYGLVEACMPGYPYRTKLNVKMGDGTLIIAKDFKSAGTALTIRLCEQFNKPYLQVGVDKPPSHSFEFKAWLKEHDIQTLNVAGTRESKCPGIANFTKHYITANFRETANVRQNQKG